MCGESRVGFFVHCPLITSRDQCLGIALYLVVSSLFLELIVAHVDCCFLRLLALLSYCSKASALWLLLVTC